MSFVVAITWQHFIELTLADNLDLPLEFRRYLLSFRRYKYFRFSQPHRHFRLLVAVAITCQHFLRALYGRKSRICRWNSNDVSHSFQFQQPFSVVVHYWNRLGTFSCTRYGEKPQICRCNFDDISHTFRDISTSGFGRPIAICDCRSSSKLLSLRSPWSIISGSQLKRTNLSFLKQTPGGFLTLSAPGGRKIQKRTTRVNASVP